MSQYQTEAILLAVRDWGDADRMVTLFSREFGKIYAIAYGARRPRNRLSGTVQSFAYVDAYLVPGKNYDSLKQCEIRQSFRRLREDLSLMAYTALIAELAGELWPEREAEPAVFELLLAAFSLMGDRNPRLVALAAAWQLLSLAGYHPSCEHCVVCGKALALPAFFDPQAGGVVCGHCQQGSLLNFTDAVYEFIQRLLSLEWASPGHFTVNSTVLLQTEKIVADYLLYCLDKPLKSMRFIQLVAKAPVDKKNPAGEK